MSLKVVENLGTTRLLLIITGVLCTLALQSELRALLTAPPLAFSNCDHVAAAVLPNNDHYYAAQEVVEASSEAPVGSMVTPLPEEEQEEEVADKAPAAVEDETTMGKEQLQQQPAAEAAATGAEATAQERRKLNFMPGLSDESRSWENMKVTRPLNFLHIPKTGGSSIFLIAAKNGLSWGECLFPSSWRIRKCPNETNIGKWPEHPYDAPWWHTPIQYLPKNKKPYNKQDLFAVMRNPYERAVSEYYYYCQIHKRECYSKDKQDSAERMNRELQQFLGTALRAEKNSSEYFIEFGHWIPQYDYFFNTTASGRKERIVKHVLHHEYLNDEFAALVQAYGYNFTLPQKHMRSRKDMGAKLTTADLTEKTMKLIDIVYEKDFQIGNYEMLTGIVAEA